MRTANPRSRVKYALLLLLVIGLGLGSRSPQIPLPHFIVAYAGDMLWALLVFLGFGFLFPHSSIRRSATAAAFFSLFIELSQLYHAPWLDAMRANPLAVLVLGRGFLWSDLVCYAVGIVLGTLLEGAAVSRWNEQDLQA
jgi:hypothetical protein